MAQKLDVNFAFEGFRVVREKPWLVAVWGFARLFLFAIIGVPAYYAVKQYGPQIQQVFAGLQGKNPDPQVVLGFVGTFIGGYMVFLIVMLLVSAVFTCAVFRAAFREPKEGIGYFRFGGDEWRQVGAVLLYVLLAIAAYIGIIIVFAIGAVALGKNGLGVVIAILVILLVVAVVFLMVRLSLFQVQTFATRKINLFGSWRLTEGNFWALLGGYLIAAVMALLVSVLASTIISVIVGLITGNFQESAMTAFGVNGMSGAGQPKDINSVLAMLTTPRFLLTIGLQEVLSAPLIMAVMTAPGVAAYRQLTGSTTMAAENVF